jgi:hypothetical protein
MIRTLLVFWFIAYCFRIRTGPWRFFRLNADFFNVEKGIYSKFDMDRYIPKKWRLEQQLFHESLIPTNYPVFVKPEWGQNSYGIKRIDCHESFKQLTPKLKLGNTRFLVQEAAREGREFEVFYLRSAKNSDDYSVLSITEVMNIGEEEYPINSIHNPESRYVDRTGELTEEERLLLWKYIKSIGYFRIARCGLRADTVKELLRGNFHVIEINLFLPMPLYLCDNNVNFKDKYRFIKKSMLYSAELVKELPVEQEHSSIFFRKLITHYRVKSWPH